ncbi:Hypothetical predicted protein [Podarcis lilfordi]|uniref:Uncharacterized protein n=1 Tax=Podarcis lilfordi TaxID=74358 RepID=A0AA35KNI3_9SAUR|nr:Hypothetical predicted protein [Podarcis lilfordi]
MICYFKVAYTKFTSWMINIMDTDQDLDLMACWKSSSFAHYITYIKQAVDIIKPKTMSGCWQNLWKECVHNFKGFPSIATEVNNIVQMTRQVGGDGFVDLIYEDMEELIEGQQLLTLEKEGELGRSSSECKNEDGEHESNPNCQAAFDQKEAPLENNVPHNVEFAAEMDKKKAARKTTVKYAHVQQPRSRYRLPLTNGQRNSSFF